MLYNIYSFFTIGNGTRQGSVLSPHLFSRYIRELLSELEAARVGCCVGGQLINVLAYAVGSLMEGSSAFTIDTGKTQC